MTTTDPIRAALDGIRFRDRRARHELIVANAIESQADVAPMLAALEVVYEAVQEMQANGDGCDLDDPEGEAWHRAAQMALDAITEHLGGLTNEH